MNALVRGVGIREPGFASMALGGPTGRRPRRLRDLRVLRGSALNSSPRSLPPTIGR